MKLWRGDSDLNSVRKLRMTLPIAEGLCSNLINGGNPFALSQKSLRDSIQHHVVPGWSTTHFLSFTKDRSIAEVFAVGNSGLSLSPSDQMQWQSNMMATIVVELDVNKMQHMSSLGVGIDHYEFDELSLIQNLIQISIGGQFARMLAHQNRPSAKRNVVLIDVHAHLSYLQAQGHYVDPLALTFSHNDQEVLVIPVDQLSSGAGATAILDFGCISAIDYYDLI